MNNTTILVVQAHPDDADFYCGGTIAKYAKEGSEIIYVVCTDGSKGTLDKNLSPSTLAAIRKKEQIEANKILGVKKTIFLDYPDLELSTDKITNLGVVVDKGQSAIGNRQSNSASAVTPYSALRNRQSAIQGSAQSSVSLRESLVRVYREFRPNVLFTFDPWKCYEFHPDHTVCGKEAIYARLCAKLPHSFPEHLKEGIDTHTINEIYLFNTDTPDVWVEIENWFDIKLKALCEHHSQFDSLACSPEEAEQLLKSVSSLHPETKIISEAFKYFKLEGMLK